VCGISLFGAVSGLTALLFVGQKPEHQPEIKVVLQEIKRMQIQLDDIRNQSKGIPQGARRGA
jgi:hypothetical protein